MDRPRTVRALGVALLLALGGVCALAEPGALSLSAEGAASLAVERSAMLGAADASVAMAWAEARVARGERRLSAALHLLGAVGDAGTMYGSSPGVMPESMTDAMPGSSVRLALRAAYLLSDGGRLGAMADAAASAARSSEATRAERERDLRLMATLAYKQALLAEAMLTVSKREVEALEEQVRVARRKLELGRVAQADVLREEAALASARMREADARGMREMALVDLRAALSLEPGAPLALTDTLGIPELETERAHLSEIARTARPALRAADDLVAAARSEVEAADAAGKPQVWLQGTTRADAMSGERARGAWGVALSASVPLSDGGMRRGGRERARAMLAMREQDRTQVGIEVEREVSEALVEHGVAAEQLALADAGIRSAEEAYRVTTIRYDAGRTVVAELLDALRMRTEAYAMRAAAAYRADAAGDRLVRAVGDASVVRSRTALPLTWEAIRVEPLSDSLVRLSTNGVSATELLAWLAREGHLTVELTADPAAPKVLSGSWTAPTLAQAAERALTEAGIACHATATGLVVTGW